MLEQIDAFLTIIDDLCELLKIGRNAAYHLVNSGEIKSLKNGRVWRIPKEAVVEYTKRMTNLA